MTKPSVLFVCVHNAGRSQMAAAFLTHLSGGAIEVRSAGSEPAEQVNPAAVQAMAEVGIDIAAEKPKILTDQAVRESDVVITMGCGDTCPFYPGKRYEDWVLDDPAGQGVDSVRPIRDTIKQRVETLIGELLPTNRAARTAPTKLGPAESVPGESGVSRRPRVLFVCVKNGGKSQMAAGLMRRRSAGSVEVVGRHPAGHGDQRGVGGCAGRAGHRHQRRGAEGDHRRHGRGCRPGGHPGREAHLEPVGGTPVENWDTDEPSERGIDGLDRMRLVRDDIDRRVQQLLIRLQPAGNSSS